MDDDIFSNKPQFDVSEFVGYPLVGWLSSSGLLQVSAEKSEDAFSVGFLNQTNAEFISNNTITEEISYLYVSEDFETLQPIDNQQLTVEPVSNWNTSVGLVEFYIEQEIETSSKIDPNRVAVFSRGTNPVLFFDNFSSITAPTRSSALRELNYVVDQGEWFVAIADVPEGSLHLESSPASIHWVSSSEILNSNKIQEYSDIKLDILSVSTTSEYVELDFEEVDINALDVLCSDLYLYQVINNNETIAFNYHFPESIIVEKIKPVLQLSWSIFYDKNFQNGDGVTTYLVI